MTSTICMPEGNNPAYHSQRHRPTWPGNPGRLHEKRLAALLAARRPRLWRSDAVLCGAILRGRDRLDGAPCPGASRRILAPGENIRGPTRQMLFLKEC